MAYLDRGDRCGRPGWQGTKKGGKMNTLSENNLIVCAETIEITEPNKYKFGKLM